MTTQDSFRNPFSDYSANAMDTEKILDYWCSPFSFFESPISEQDIFQHDMPIVFLGGRGSGKTMFLKYFSYPVQCEEARRSIDRGHTGSILSFLKSRGGIGFYLRFDGPELRSFEGKGLDTETWDAIFTQYFELKVCKSYVEVILDLVKRDQLVRSEVEEGFVPRAANKLVGSTKQATTLEDVLDIIQGALDEISSFRSRVAFSKVRFTPSKPFVAQDLSFGMVEIARETIREFKSGVKFVLLIDEYENYLKRQQVILNTLFKFVRLDITFRIGMRLEGFHTYETTSPQEFIKEGRDYTKFVFEDILVKDRRYSQFLMSVATKRLEAVPVFKERNYLDISRFLGKKENLESEAVDLVRGEQSNVKHFDLLKRSDLLKHRLSDKAVDDLRKTIGKPENPLLEVLNILWVMRGNSPDDTKKAMDDYLSKTGTPLGRKYRLDYVDKYKLSLMILLASQYRKSKKYYSFNTFCFLSSGIVGSFIELCRRSFQYAYFENPGSLIERGEIPRAFQDRAARDMANTELEMADRIHDHGHKLYLFARNLGSLFEKYQKDPLMRYPETNQFTIDASVRSDPELFDIFRAACRWSVVQPKSTLQKEAPGAPRSDIYTLNRILSPAFGLTYRTRGAHSVKVDAAAFRGLMTQDGVMTKLGPKETFRLRPAKKRTAVPDGLQQRLM